ncbi:hypothetical protein GCM10027259_17610 [Micromonospora palomenae]
MGMPEWTLCADLKVYARVRAVAKPATPPVTRTTENGREATSPPAPPAPAGSPKTRRISRVPDRP